MYEGSKAITTLKDSDLILTGFVYSYTENSLIIDLPDDEDFSRITEGLALVYIYNSMKGEIVLEAKLDEVALTKLMFTTKRVVRETQKRDDIRVDVDTEIKVAKIMVGITDLKNSCMLKVINVSAGGVRFFSKLSFPTDTIFHFNLSLTDGMLIPVVAKVVRKEAVENGLAYGCKFIEIEDTDKDILRRFIFKTQIEQHRFKKL